MSLLNFEPSGPMPKGEKKSLKIFLGISLLVGTIALGSTLAASINLNDSGPVEFGQGVTQTVACDSDGITLTPYSTFSNDSQYADFYFSSLEVAGVSSNCSGVTFKLRAYMNGDSNPLMWPSDPNGDSFEFGFTASGDWNSVDSCMDLFDWETTSSTNNSVVIDWSSCVPDEAALAGQVDRITVETSNSSSSDVFPVVYELGDVGPGGGLIFYKDEIGFTCGPDMNMSCNYLEAAPNTWSNDTSDGSSIWCSTETAVGGTSSAIGWGHKNTELISGTCAGATVATQIISTTIGGESDWFIPSQNEAVEFYNQRALFTGVYSLSGDEVNTDPARYLTSTQEPTFLPAVHFLYVKWIDGTAEYGAKTAFWSFRPIRAF